MDKPLQIVFKNMETSEALEQLIRKRVVRLERLTDRIVSCRVVVEVPHRSAGSGKVPLAIAVEVELSGRGKLVAKDEDDRRALKADDTAYVNHAFEKMERRLRDATVSKAERAGSRQEGEMDTGVIVKLFPEQDYGFIEVAGSPNLYFTGNAVLGHSFDELEIGMMVHVTRATTEGPMGPQASSVRLAQASRSPN